MQLVKHKGRIIKTKTRGSARNGVPFGTTLPPIWRPAKLVLETQV